MNDPCPAQLVQHFLADDVNHAIENDDHAGVPCARDSVRFVQRERGIMLSQMSWRSKPAKEDVVTVGEQPAGLAQAAIAWNRVVP